MIKEFEFKDFDSTLELCGEHFQAVEMGERLYTFDSERSEDTLRSVLNGQAFRNWITSENGITTGIISFTLYSSPFGNQVIANEFLWYARKNSDFIRLFKHAMKNIKCDVFNIGIPALNNDVVQTYLLKQGFKFTTLTLSKEGNNV